MARTIANPPDIRADVAVSRTTLATSYHFPKLNGGQLPISYDHFAVRIARFIPTELMGRWWPGACRAGRAELSGYCPVRLPAQTRAYGMRNSVIMGKPSAGALPMAMRCDFAGVHAVFDSN